MPLIRVSEAMKEELDSYEGRNYDERIRRCKQDVNNSTEECKQDVNNSETTDDTADTRPSAAASYDTVYEACRDAIRDSEPIEAVSGRH